jgi:cellulose synthase/poly-beta-1,6-N-acetylglucosamine synthase-like glycosyltransferase
MGTARERAATSAGREPGRFSDLSNEGRARDSSFGRAASDAGAIAHDKSWFRRELWLTSVGVCLTLLGAVMLGVDVGGILLQRIRSRSVAGTIEHAAFLLIVYYFVYANLIYLFARRGHLSRRRDHLPASRDELESIYASEQPPSLTVLVPSYKEERDVVLQTLLSAGLMEYPSRRVVLLIDDPPKPGDAESAHQLARMRGLPHEVDQMLETPRRRFASALAGFQLRAGDGWLDLRLERKRLAELYREAGYWFEKIASSFEVGDHTDQMFVERILQRPAQEHFARAHDIASRPLAEPPVAGLLREYRRLASLFAARFSAFERKRYANLSHAANKAMNLNSYISLIGKSFRVLRLSSGLHLEECGPQDGDFSVSPCDYLITLDADSLLLNDYAIRLVHFMEQPGNQRVAVAQTPYSAVPGSPNFIERIAGATTDIQHIIHQGFTWVGATYWVGANALLRRSALDDIAEVAEERGHRVTKYIQDRTVIEDTESSVDLIARGWSLYNYPDRLAYSATPPDFGALVIQRRRWANGGLIILPKLLRYLTSGTQAWRKVPEASMRVYYLTSLTGVSVGMLVLLSYPFENDMRSWWLALTAAPYYFLYARDLVISGYRWADWPRVWALNLLLIPVHLGGIFKSLHQAFTGHATPFVRTPKVEGRTTAPRLYILGALGMLALCVISGVIDVVGCRLIGAKGDDWLHLAFAVFNGTLVLYAIVYFIGLQAAWEDLGLARRLGEALTRSPRILAPEAD